MKRSLLDPLPRQLSTKALAALVALVVCGTGIAVARFLESGATAIRHVPAEVRAATPIPDDARPSRTTRPSTRGTAYSIGSVPDAVESERCQSRASLGVIATDGREPTLARPPVEGS